MYIIFYLGFVVRLKTFTRHAGDVWPGRRSYQVSLISFKSPIGQVGVGIIHT